MEHLPKSSYQFSHLAIPYLAGPKYDDQGFEGFPSRLGYDVQKIMRGDFSGHSVLEIEAFSQSWLFFALMSQVLDCSVDENDFIREEQDVENFRNKGERKVIKTGTYITLRDKRREHEKSWLFDKKHTWYNDSYSALVLATEYLSQLAINAHRGIAPMPLRPEIELWLSVMVSTMKFETAHMFSAGIPTKPLVDEGGVATNHLVMDLLRADGWCESHVRMLASSMDAAAVYYICSLGPPKIKKDHGKCSNEKCEADQIVDSEYVTRHRTDGCQCEYLGPDPEQVREILDSGSFPCIKVTCNRATTDGAVDNLPNLTVGVVPFHQDQNPIHYVALSHVWSGGLGNPIANALPRCQLLWLYDQVAAMPETRSNEDDNSVYFWMDTLCVPLYPESARQRAIRSMRNIYNESHAVLVLDSELLLSTANCTNEERLMRVSNSSWMRRLWTYQEAILAKSVFFLFIERAVSIEELWAPLFHGSIYDRFSNGISIQGSRFYQTLRWVSRYNAPTRFLSLLDALQWRQTSKMRDECVCVAALFGYDTDKIFGVPDKDKLKKLLELQGTFIKGFPFLSGPKMVEDGYRWAPGALMRRRGSEVLDMVEKCHTQDVYARWTPDGLWGEWYGFVLSTDCNQMRLDGGESPQSFLVACSRNSKRYAVTRAFEPNPEDEPDWDQVGLHRLENPAIVLETDVDSIVGKHFPSLGILVDIRRKNQGIWFARYQCRVMVREYLVDDTSDGDEAGEVSSHVYPVTERTEGEEHKYHGYPWCII